MKKKLQKFFAIVLALSMTMSLLCVSAFAEEETGEALADKTSTSQIV